MRKNKQYKITPQYKMKRPKIKKLILSGGGVKGISFCGVLEKLDNEIKILSTVKTIIGTSIGALIASLIAIGVTIRKIRAIFDNINFSDLQDYDINLFLSKFGFDSGQKFYSLIKASFAAQNINPNITFQELSLISKYELIIVGTNINETTPTYFSLKNTPDIPVTFAIRISCGYPFILVPVELNGSSFADGGLVSPLASELVEKKERKHTLGVVIYKTVDRYEYTDIQSYTSCIVACLFNSLLEHKLKLLKHTILIKHPTNPLDLTMPKELKEDLYEQGKIKASEWLDKFI